MMNGISKTANDKILVIGLDAVDPDLLMKFIERGLLPNFKNLIDKGAYGRLKTTLPIITSVSWTSFITGKNPGKHGIFGFVNFKNGSYDLKILNSYDRKSQALWHVLNRYGKTVGIFNLPCLYPPEKIDKFMICGMLTPNKRCQFVYPPQLQAELLSAVNGYDIDINVAEISSDTKERLLKNIYYLTDKRYATIKFLLSRYPCDVFVSVLTETDRIEHYFHNDEKVLQDYFKYLDEKIENLLQGLKQDTSIFIVSDHGMYAAKKYVYINKWLQETGYLTVNRKSADYIKHSFAKRAIQSLMALLMRIKFDIGNIKQLLPAKLVNHFVYLYCYCGGVDWRRTKAYFCSGAGWGVFINSKRRFGSGIVRDEENDQMRDEIIKGILEIKDPETGAPVIKNAYKREEILKGEMMHEAPDIILQPCDGYIMDESAEAPTILRTVQPNELMWGEHSLEGIFIAWGRDIKPGYKIKDCSILDVAPTILYKLNIPIPADFDGRILKEIFVEDKDNLLKAKSNDLHEEIRRRIKALRLSGRIK